MASELAFQKILVLRGGALGDFIVTLPALAALRERWPDARIELAGNARAAELARTRGLLDAVHSQHEARWSALFSYAPLPVDFARWLGEFDSIISYWPDPDGIVQRHLDASGAQVISAPAMPTQAPAAAHYLAAMQPLGVQRRELWYALRPLHRRATAGSEVPARPVRTELEAPIALHPGSGSPKKNWPAERWRELIAALPSPVLLIVGEAEAEHWSSAAFGDHVRVLAHPPLETLIAELNGCQLYVGHDSGVSHLAAACGTPAVLLFGSTDSAMWAPPAPHVTVLRRGTELSSITVDEVMAEMRKTL